MYIDPQSVTIPLAVLGGLFSFVSPCVLTLVPAYIGYLTAQAGATTTTALAAAGASGGTVSPAANPPRWAVFLHGVFFVLGFSLIFILLGISAGALGELRLGIIRSSDWISRLGGLLVIVLGLHVMGVIRIPFLYYDTRSQRPPKQELGYFGSAIMGITFSAGWSPCVGPFLTAMFALGQSSGSIGRATLLLAFYSLGLGIPFLLAALFLNRTTSLIRRLQKHMRTIEIVSGALLIVIGVLLFLGGIQYAAQYFARFTDLSIAIDQWLVNIAGGQ